MSQPIRLQTYLGLLLVVTTAITFSLIGGVILAYRIPQINAEAKAAVQHQASEKARLLEFALAGLEAQLRPIVTMAHYARLSEIGDTLDAIIDDGAQFNAAYLIDESGKIRAGGVARNGEASRVTPTGDLSRNTLFRATEKTSIAWSDKYLSAQSGQVVIGVAVRQGRWTVIGEISPAYLREGVTTVAGKSADQVLVVDRTGEWIAASDREFGPADNLGHLSIVRNALAGQQEGQQLAHAGGDVFAGSATPQRLGWTFIVTRPAGLANPDIRRALVVILFGFSGSMIIGLFIAPWWSRRLSRPLQRMIDRTHQLADGNYTGKTAAHSRIVELNDFGTDLQRMADAIREREASLARSEERLRATIENAPSVAIQWYDRDAICRYWNPASTAIYGFTREETVGRSLVGMIWTEAQRDEFIELIREIERTGEPTPPTEFAIRHKEGRLVTVLASVFAIPDAHGGHQFVCLDIDITERKRAESALLASQQELETIFNASPVPMSVSDLSRGCRIIKVNDAWVRKFGHESAEAFGRTGSEVGMYADPEDRTRFIGRFSAGVGIYDDMELWLRHADGQQFLARVSARVVEVAGQRLMLMASEDITEERRMQAELRGVNEELEARVLQRTAALTESNNELAAAMENLKTAQGQLIQSEKLAALGRLVAGVAHELNTPIGNGLMAVTTLESHHRDFTQALAEGLRRSTLDAFVTNVGTAADIATRNLERAAELIASFKQVAADQTSSQRRTFVLQTVIEEILTAMRPTLRRSGHLVETLVPAGLRFDSFPGPLGQVLTNLIDNAVRHGFDGHEGGTIRISAARLDDGQVELRVADNGRGIAAEHLPRVFDPFFTTRLGQGGSGLGLNIVHNIVVSVLGGSVAAESTPGAGTCFILTLPATAPVSHRHEP